MDSEKSSHCSDYEYGLVEETGVLFLTVIGAYRYLDFSVEGGGGDLLLHHGQLTLWLDVKIVDTDPPQGMPLQGEGKSATTFSISSLSLSLSSSPHPPPPPCLPLTHTYKRLKVMLSTK